MSDPIPTIRELVAHAAQYLPAQGPISAFVHHNTLHAFEELPFDDAVRRAAALYGAQPYLSEARYREELTRGRIRASDLDAVLREELGVRADERIAGLVARVELWSAMLHDPVRMASDAEVHWVVAAADALRRFRRKCPASTREQMIADTRQWLMRELRWEGASNARSRGLAADLIARLGAGQIEYWSASAWEEVTLTLLWRVCRRGAGGVPASSDPPVFSPRPRDWLHAAIGEDTDRLVHDVLIRFSAVFADQGLTVWDLPERDRGFWRAFSALYGRTGFARERWLAALPGERARQNAAGLGAEESITESLSTLGVAQDERQEFVTRSLLALRGWAGMLWQLESRPDRARRPLPRGTLCEFLAVRLVLERIALAHVAREAIGYTGPLDGLRQALAARGLGLAPARPAELSVTQRAYRFFLLSQSLGWTPRRLAALTSADWEELARAVKELSGIERQRLFHLAYERRYRTQVLDALAAHRGGARRPAGARPPLQVICCIDEREESFRRHLEEVMPEAETFGAAGFFGVAVYYRGVWETHERPLCPVAIRPRHRVRERVVESEAEAHGRRASWLRRFGLAAHRIHAGSRGLASGLLTALLGSAAALPLVARVLFPRLAGKLRRGAGAFFRADVATELALARDGLALARDGLAPARDGNERAAAGDGPADGVEEGFRADEMAAIVEALLRGIGLTSSLARLVVVAGHGSSSLNNPHEAAHDCGACGGGRGGPNARAFALMANDPAVRRLLADRGLEIPGDTLFVGAYHDTCDDSLVYYDQGVLPDSHRDEIDRAQLAIQRALERNAHERCRRFRTAPLVLSTQEALRHVESRAADLAQPRPELGHASNAVCVIGRRARTRGLFMDRRSFLVSYDPACEEADPERPLLTRILQAVLPVCAGISLEYFFSYVDPIVWGCGTKLPHNIASLVGVMDGAASDLRPGLPWQMVEIHEPLRLLAVVEVETEALRGVLARNVELDRLCRNAWIQIAALDPVSSGIHVFAGGEFRRYTPESTELPEATSSECWYGGLREHLEFAAIRSSAGARVGEAAVR